MPEDRREIAARRGPHRPPGIGMVWAILMPTTVPVFTALRRPALKAARAS